MTTKSTTKQPTAVPQAMGPWTVTKETYAYAANVLMTILRTTNKAVILVENEVDNLDSEQKLRLEANNLNRQNLLDS